MAKVNNTAQTNNRRQLYVKKYSLYLLGIGVLFILSAALFCPVTQAAVTEQVLPFFNSLNLSFKITAHLAFISLLVIGLRMQSKYQD